MKCPICGKPLRPSKKDPAYGLCDNCKKRFKLKNETEAVTKTKKTDSVTKTKKAPAKTQKTPANVKNTEKQTQPKKKKKGKLFKFFLAFFLIVVLAGIAYFFLFGKDTPTKTADNNSSQTTETDASASDSQGSVISAETYNDITISLINTTESKGDSLASPSDGNIFYICEFQIENKSEDSIVINSLSDIEAFCGDYSVSEDIAGLLLSETEGKSSLDGTIAVGQTFTGVVTYQIPKDYDQMQLRLAPDFWNGDTAVFTVSKE